MARAPRLALAGELHYLIQRGHNQQAVFADDHDREAYLAMLHEAAVQAGVAIHAYALLPEAVHLLATPGEVSSMSRMMQSLGRRYVAAYNRRHGRSGTLWEGRFRAGLIDAASHGADAWVHIECLPVRAGLAAAAADWPWSSAAHYLGRRRDPLLVEHRSYWALGNTPFERELAHALNLSNGVPGALAEAFQRSAMKGQAMGTDTFVAHVEAQARVSLAARPRGRPPLRGRRKKA